MSLHKRVLMTGHKGYIGSVMAPFLRRAGHEVVGVDTEYFGECTLVPDRDPIAGIRKDIRDLEPRDVEGFDAVVHLAALSNDPVGNLNARWTAEINHFASVRLAECARYAGVPRFLFSSSCIMYGTAAALVVNEQSPLAPQTEYARSKVRSEQAIGELARPGFSPTFLRNGTVYGLSPRMRFDTVFNDLVAAAVTARRVTVHGDGEPWRPVVHIEDVARAFLAVIDAPIETVHNQAFNVGSEAMNCQIRRLAELAAAVVPGCQLEVSAKASADRRTYRTDFSKFARTFPDVAFAWTPDTGASHLRGEFESASLTAAQYRDPRFTRLAWLQHLVTTNRLTPSLRWSPAGDRGSNDPRRQDRSVAANC